MNVQQNLTNGARTIAYSYTKNPLIRIFIIYKNYLNECHAQQESVYRTACPTAPGSRKFSFFCAAALRGTITLTSALPFGKAQSHCLQIPQDMQTPLLPYKAFFYPCLGA